MSWKTMGESAVAGQAKQGREARLAIASKAFNVLVAFVLCMGVSLPDSVALAEIVDSATSHASAESSDEPATSENGESEQAEGADEGAADGDESADAPQDGADGSDEAVEGDADGSDEVATDDASDQEESDGDADAGEAADAIDDEAANDSEAAAEEEGYEAGTLVRTIKTADKKRYTVTLDYGADARIPANAKLSIKRVMRTPEGYDAEAEEWQGRPTASEEFVSAKAMAKREAQLHEALDVQEGDEVFYEQFLQIAVEAKGKKVRPAASVDVTVETDAVPEERSGKVAASFFADVPEGAEHAAPLAVEDLSGEDDAEKKYEDGLKVRFAADKLSELGLAGFVTAEELEAKAAEEAAEAEAEAAAEFEEQEAAKKEAAEKEAAERNAADADADAAGKAAEQAAPTVLEAASGAQAAAPATPLASSLNAVKGAYRVSISYGAEAGIPEGATLQVRELYGSEYEYARARTRDALESSGDRTAVTSVRAFDITILDADGNEVEPEAPVSVTINMVGAQAAGDPAIVHLNSEGAEVIQPEATSTAATTQLDFTANSFSVYAVAYTVDFHWGDFTYNLQGEGDILLSELLRILGASTQQSANEREASEEAISSVDLLALADNMSRIESVSFSDPTLVSVKQVQAIPQEYMDDDEGEEGEEKGEDDEALLTFLRDDWMLVSLEPFDTEETLTIKLSDGNEVNITVTDERRSDGTAASGGRVVVDGVTYSLTNGGILGGKTHSEAYGDSRAYDGKATAYAITAGCTLHDEIEYNGKLYKVWNIAQYLDSNKLTGIGVKLDPQLVNRASGYSFRLPEMKTDITQAEKDQLAADGFTFGVNNNTADNKLWKKATYNPDTNSIDYEIKTFQAMKENVPLDFIFIYDDSITMYTGDRGAPTNNAGNNYNETVIREAMGTRLLILSAAQALMEDKSGYDIRMAMAGASNGDNRRSTWYIPTQGGYAGVTDYLASYATGVTDHVLGLNNARTLATESRNTTAANGQKRQPIVIYLSDFIDGGTVRNITNAATQLHNIAPVYCLSTRNSRTYARLEAIASEKDSGGMHSSYIHTMSEINEGVEALETIIKDAIGYYMKKPVTVTDNLSEALSGYDVAAGTTSGGANAGAAPAGKGKSTWTIGGTSPYPGAGTVYTENFSVKLDDNTVYTGAMPTNGKATVTVEGSEVNSLEPKENDPDTDPADLHIAKDVTFLVGKTNEKGKLMRDEASGLPLDGSEVQDKVQFTLTEQGQNAPIATYTVADGSFTVPFTVGEGSGKQVVLQMGKTYVLHEVEDSVTGPGGYNETVTSGKLVAPDKDWLINVSDKGVITVTVNGAANQTPEATVAKAIMADSSATPPVAGKPARFVLWNNIIVPATLIPIKVRKVWNSNEHLDPVPFSVYGLDMATGAKTADPLPAYSQKDVTSARVQYITPENSTVTTEDGKAVWTVTVWVPDKLAENGTELKFYDDDKVTLQELQNISQNHSLRIGLTDTTNYTAEYVMNNYGTDTDGDGVKDQLICNQTYSYAVDEGELVYEEGWYTPKYSNSDNPDAISNDVYIGEWSEGNAEKIDWNPYTDTRNDALQLHLNFSNFKYDKSNSDQEDFKSWFGNNDLRLNSDARLKKFYSNLDSIIIGVYDSNEKAYYKLKFGEGTVTRPYSHDSYYVSTDGASGSIYYDLPMPSAWAEYGTDGSRGGRIKNLSIVSIAVTASKHTDHPFILYGTDPETGAAATTSNSFPNGPDADANHRTEIEVKNTNLYIGNFSWHPHPFGNRYKNFTTVKNASVTKRVVTPAVPSKEEGRFIKTSCTLGIENSWVENPLLATKVVKNWVNSEGGNVPSEAIEAAGSKITLNVEGQAPGGAAKNLNGSVHTTKDWTSPVSNVINGDPGATSWEQMVYLPQYDTDTYDKNDVNTPTEYDYSVTEEPITGVVRDADGYPMGAWTKNEVHKSLEEWNDYPYYKDAYLKVTRTKSERKYNNNDTFKFCYISERGNVYETELSGFTNLKDLSQKEKTFFLKLTIPQSEDVSSLWLLESGLVQNGAFEDKVPYTGDDHSYVALHYDEVADSVTIKKWTKADGSGNKYYGLWTGDQAPGFRQAGSWSEWTRADNPSIALQDIEFVNDGPADEEEGTVIEASNVSLRKYVIDAYTITNTFTPNKAVTLRSDFVDNSGDEASTNVVTSVTYTIKDGDGNVVRTTSATPNTAKTIYLPKGDYSITQSYSVGSDAKLYALDGSLDAYDVKYKVDSGANTDGTVYSANVNSNRSVTFTNTRKILPVTVQTQFDPALGSEASDPSKRPLGTDKSILYALKYYKADGTLQTADNGVLNDSTFETSDKNYRRNHTTNIPSYSVREEPVECKVDDSTGLSSALPDYDCNIIPEEQTVSGAKKLVFTIEASIKRANIIVNKLWDEIANYDDVTLTYTLKRSDGENIYGTTKKSVTLTLNRTTDWTGGFDLGTVPDPDDQANTLTLLLPIIRSTEPGVKYVLTESADGTNATYYPIFADTTGASGTEFEQIDQSGAADRTEARFKLTGKGIIINVTNADKPYICKIVDDAGEHPFRTLNRAVQWARENMDGTATIQMLVDYAVPQADKVTLKTSSVTINGQDTSVTDNIVITTAATSGGVYNFTDTLAGKADADKGTAILARSWNGGTTAEQAMFYIDDASASLTTGNIVLDGKEGGAQHTGRAVYVNKGSLGANGNTTFRNFNLSGNGGAVYASNALAYTVSDTGNVLFDSCVASNNNGGGIYAGGALTMTGAGKATFTSCTANYGGGIYQNGTGDMALTNITFGVSGDAGKGCFAEFDGGSVYSKSTNTTMTDCDFYYSKAGSGANDNATHGGAVFISSNGGEHQILGCVFDHCSANTMKDDGGYGNGGAVYVANGAKSLTVDRSEAKRSSFTNCSAHRFGGAVILEPNGSCTLSISHADFEGCYTEIRGGGAVYSDSNIASFEDCTFKGCHSDSTNADFGGGGAIYMNGDTGGIESKVTITGCQFEDCYAEKNGGAIHFYSTGTNATLTNVQITGHKSLAAGTANAKLGSAIYSKGNLTIKQSGTGTSEITGCSASDASGGAVNVASGKSVTFEGNVVVEGNTNTTTDTGHEHNVVLEQDNNTTIKTAAPGLGENARIGVYVSGALDGDLMKKHGVQAKPFGTYDEGADGNLQHFVNDRYPLLTGFKGEAYIIWTPPQVEVYTYDKGYFDQAQKLAGETEYIPESGMKSVAEIPGELHYTIPDGYSYDTSIIGAIRDVIAISDEAEYKVQNFDTAQSWPVGEPLKIYYRKAVDDMVPVLVKKVWGASVPAEQKAAQNGSIPIREWVGVTQGDEDTVLLNAYSTSYANDSNKVAVVNESDTADGEAWSTLVYLPKYDTDGNAYMTYNAQEGHLVVKDNNGSWSDVVQMNAENRQWAKVASGTQTAYLQLRAHEVYPNQYGAFHKLLVSYKDSDGNIYRSTVEVSGNTFCLAEDGQVDKAYYVKLTVPGNVDLGSLKLLETANHGASSDVAVGDSYGLASYNSAGGRTGLPRFSYANRIDNGKGPRGGLVTYTDLAFLSAPPNGASAISGTESLEVYDTKKLTITNHFVQDKTFTFTKKWLDGAGNEMAADDPRIKDKEVRFDLYKVGSTGSEIGVNVAEPPLKIATPSLWADEEWKNVDQNTSITVAKTNGFFKYDNRWYCVVKGFTDNANQFPSHVYQTGKVVPFSGRVFNDGYYDAPGMNGNTTSDQLKIKDSHPGGVTGFAFGDVVFYKDKVYVLNENPGQYAKINAAMIEIGSAEGQGGALGDLKIAYNDQATADSLEKELRGRHYTVEKVNTDDDPYVVKAGDLVGNADWSVNVSHLEGDFVYYAVERSVKEGGRVDLLSNAQILGAYNPAYEYSQDGGTVVTKNTFDPIARVGNNVGTASESWKYYLLLQKDGVVEGAFDEANKLSGNVVIELLKQGPEDGVTDDTLVHGRAGTSRYTMGAGFTFNNEDIGNLIIRTAPKSDSSLWNTTGFTSVIKRGYNGASLISVDGIGKLTIENVIFDGGATFTTGGDGNRVVGGWACTGNGGIISVGSGVSGVSGVVDLKENTVLRRSLAVNGGAVYATNSTVTFERNAALEGNAALASGGNGGNGGAIFVDGGTLVLGDSARIAGNMSSGNGAGIYLGDDATLNISGSPSFGGVPAIDGGGNIVMTDSGGNLVGNYKDGSLDDGATNGSAGYPRARQDIYLTEAHENAPESIVVTGDLTGEAGSIWVWAASEYHYKQLMPFAKLGDGVGFAEPNDEGALPEGKFNAANLSVFRNAQDDDATENGTDTWLSGSIEGDPGYIYWSGIAGFKKVILRKTNGNFESLAGATFNLYRGNSSSVYTWKDRHDKTKKEVLGRDSAGVEHLVSTENGTIWVGELPTGTYYLEETQAPQAPDGNYNTGWFYLIVSKEGVHESAQFETRAAAKEAAEKA